jgi:uncharacterized membrane protein YgaE (UPF0421/DUF939 family)
MYILKKLYRQINHNGISRFHEVILGLILAILVNYLVFINEAHSKPVCVKSQPQQCFANGGGHD